MFTSGTSTVLLGVGVMMSCPDDLYDTAFCAECDF
jgi:hypothetical protein